MRFIFKLALGMIIFNAMLIMLGQYFPDANDITTKNPMTDDPNVDKEVGEYKSLNKGTITNWIIDFAGIFGGTVLIGALASKLAGFTISINQFIGASLIISIFFSLWNGFTSPLVGISESMGLTTWYDLFLILFGIIVILSVAEIFTGKGDIDA